MNITHTGKDTTLEVETPIFDSVRSTISNSISPWVVTALNGDKIAFALVNKTLDSKNKKLFSNIRWRLEEGIKCRKCNEFLNDIVKYYFKKGSVFKNVCKPVYKELAKQGEFKRKSVKLSEETGPIKVIVENFGKAGSGGYEHLYVNPTELSDLKTFNSIDYEWYFNQYLDVMLRLLEENKGDGKTIIDTLQILLKNLEKVPYGDKLENSTKWFLRAMEKYVKAKTTGEQYKVAVEALVKAPLTRGEGADRVCVTYVSQVNGNILPALAVCKNENKLRGLLTARLNPDDYQRAKAPPTEGQLKVAINICKNVDLNMTLLKLAEVPKYGGRLIPIVNDKRKGALSAWNDTLKEMKIKQKTKKNSAAGNFANRCKSVAVSSMRELFNMEDLTGLEMYMGSHVTGLMLTKFPDSAKHLFIHKHSWGFRNKKPISHLGLKVGEWKKVTALHFMARNMFIGIEGATVVDKSLMGNTYFAEFLTPAYNRKLKSAMEHLNSTTIMDIPSFGPYALGVGVSAKDKHKVLRNIRGYKFRLNGKEFKIKHMS